MRLFVRAFERAEPANQKRIYAVLKRALAEKVEPKGRTMAEFVAACDVLLRKKRLRFNYASLKQLGHPRVTARNMFD